MEKTLRKCGSSSGSNFHPNHLDINSLPFVIPKAFQITSNRLPDLDYHLDIHRFNYTFKTENVVLAKKRERIAAEQAAAEQQAAAEEAAAAAAAEEEAADTEDPAAEECAVAEDPADATVSDCSEDSCDVLSEPHPTNPFLSVSGDVLIPTTVDVDIKPKQGHSQSNHNDIVNDFDVQNSNPFDGAELQSLSNFDALKSILAPEPTHDFSLLDRTPSTASDPVYAEVVLEKKPPPDPIYSTVNKPPAVIRSRKIEAKGSIEISNGPHIHSDFSAISPSSTFEVDQSYSPPAYTPPSPVPTRAQPVASCSPFPKIPEEVVARAMQRLEHNQEKCYEFLKEVLEVMTLYECSAEVAEAASLIECDSTKIEGKIILIKQFTELGFSVEDITIALKQQPADRDALLDVLVSNS